jgi:hypothetical protein
MLVNNAHSDDALGGNNALRFTDERGFTAIEPAVVREYALNAMLLSEFLRHG